MWCAVNGRMTNAMDEYSTAFHGFQNAYMYGASVRRPSRAPSAVRSAGLLLQRAETCALTSASRALLASERAAAARHARSAQLAARWRAAWPPRASSSRTIRAAPASRRQRHRRWRQANNKFTTIVLMCSNSIEAPSAPPHVVQSSGRLRPVYSDSHEHVCFAHATWLS